MEHGGRHSAPESGRGIEVLAVAFLVPLVIATAIGLVWLWPEDRPTSAPEDVAEQITGVVTAVERAPCPDSNETSSGSASDADEPGCGTATVELTSGDQAGETQETPISDAPGSPQVEIGDDVVVALFTSPEGENFQIVDHQRGQGLWVLLAACALAVVAFGRWRGLAALVGLGVSFGVLLIFVVPAVLAGEPPLAVAIVGAGAIALTVLYLTHGPSLTTTVAVVGTLTSLALTAALSALAVRALHLTGVSDSRTAFIGADLQLNAEGLLLAGIVIGSLGVLDDATVTQAATVQELARVDPNARPSALYRAGTRVGRAHIASVVNTIVLAYAGSSLPLLILVVDAGSALGDVVTDQLIAQELVRSAVGTMGLVAAVPITTALAAWTSRGVSSAR